MKQIGIMLLVTVSALLFACQSNTQEKITLKSFKDSVSYSIGTDIGKNFKHQELDVDTKILEQGIRDILDSAQLMITEDAMKNCMENFRKGIMAKQEEKMKAQTETNVKEGEAFLEENKKKEGVVTLPSGLQYKVIKNGTGPKPTAEQTVSVNYRGKFLDGKEFDNSYDRGEPVSFPVNGVIPGWTEALQLMTVGSKWELYIPSSLGYGAHGAGQVIPPNATLIFEVELIEIKKGE
jgi:FKBP-type peptidyl-prolyl cis-trans isomerase FklB